LLFFYDLKVPIGLNKISILFKKVLHIYATSTLNSVEVA
jgi:hypothetical protein